MFDCTVPRGLRLIRFSHVMFSLTPSGRPLKTPFPSFTDADYGASTGDRLPVHVVPASGTEIPPTPWAAGTTDDERAERPAPCKTKNAVAKRTRAKTADAGKGTGNARKTDGKTAEKKLQKKLGKNKKPEKMDAPGHPTPVLHVRKRKGPPFQGGPVAVTSCFE